MTQDLPSAFRPQERPLGEIRLEPRATCSSARGFGVRGVSVHGNSATATRILWDASDTSSSTTSGRADPRWDQRGMRSRRTPHCRQVLPDRSCRPFSARHLDKMTTALLGSAVTSSGNSGPAEERAHAVPGLDHGAEMS